MLTKLHLQTTVLPDGRIELHVPDLEPGLSVDVVVSPVKDSGKESQSRRSALEIIRNLNGHRVFQTPEEVDKHLREERDAWDR